MQEQQPERLSEAYVSALEAKYKDAQAKIDILEKLVEEQSHVIETYKVKVGQIYKAVMARKAFEEVRHFPKLDLYSNNTLKAIRCPKRLTLRDAR